MSNRLASETSPYLLQHKDNPVDWYPWGPEALARAKDEQKPILLSIGYSACHWCHVMAHECFESEAIAELMNRDFINIKVDREERPDLDHIYQNVAQAITHGGGWPLTVFLTPDLVPFYGGTYFPPDDRYGRPGFPRILAGVLRAYYEDRESVAKNGERLLAYIQRHESDESDNESLSGDEVPKLSFNHLCESAERLCGYVDSIYGGLGSAPKFPNPSAFTFLWRMGIETQNPKFFDAVKLTLTQMARRGIFDQLGGGFHRYSVDERWQVPHFEKMLYDNALLLDLYGEVLATDNLLGVLTGEEKVLYRETIQKTKAFLLRDMKSSEGLFFSAFDADSEGEEGKYYVWNPKQIAAAQSQGILTSSQSEVFQRFYQITEVGNFEHGQTILEQDERELTLEEKNTLRSAEESLLGLRAKRVPPLCDTKALLSWNALTIIGLLSISKAERDPAWRIEIRDEARRTWNAVIEKFSRGGAGEMWSTTKDGKHRSPAFFDDYAFLIRASLMLWDVVPDAIILKKIQEWVNVVGEKFRDKKNGAYFFTAMDGEELITRPKVILDQAIPSGQSYWLESLILVSEHPDTSLDLKNFARNEAHRILSDLYPKLSPNPFGASSFLSAALLMERGVIEVKSLDLAEWNSHYRIRIRPPSDAEAGIQLCHHGICLERNSTDDLILELKMRTGII